LVALSLSLFSLSLALSLSPSLLHAGLDSPCFHCGTSCSQEFAVVVVEMWCVGNNDEGNEKNETVWIALFFFDFGIPGK
jgi:hypothetical protein